MSGLPCFFYQCCLPDRSPHLHNTWIPRILPHTAWIVIPEETAGSPPANENTYPQPGSVTCSSMDPLPLSDLPSGSAPWRSRADKGLDMTLYQVLGYNSQPPTPYKLDEKPFCFSAFIPYRNTFFMNLVVSNKYTVFCYINWYCKRSKKNNWILYEKHEKHNLRKNYTTSSPTSLLLTSSK